MRVRGTFFHDSSAYTQGLAVQVAAPLVQGRPVLIESAGQYGRSKIFSYRLGQKKALQSKSWDSRYFLEGLGLVRDRLLLLTWKEGVGFVLDPQDFSEETTWSYSHEGWGLAYLATDDAPEAPLSGRIVISDGTEQLRFLDPDTKRVTRSVWVRRGDRPQAMLNELESWDGLVWANVYGSDEILGVDPKSGCVRRVVNSTLRDPKKSQENVLNGIAYDPRDGSIYVTGKRWSKIFQVAFEVSLRRIENKR